MYLFLQVKLYFVGNNLVVRFLKLKENKKFQLMFMPLYLDMYARFFRSSVKTVCF